MGGWGLWEERNKPAAQRDSALDRHVGKLTVEERARLDKLLDLPQTELNPILSSQGKLLAQVAFEELAIIEPELTTTMAGIDAMEHKVREAFKRFIDLRHGLAWPMVADEDQMRMEVHAFYLDWKEREHDA